MKRMGRALAALFLALALSCGTAAGTSFPDVSAGAWYASVVEEMAAQGILKGLPDGSFHPEDAISAAEFVTIAARCAGLEGLEGRREVALCREQDVPQAVNELMILQRSGQDGLEDLL